MELMPDLEWNMVLLHIRDLVFAFILALPIGWDREKNERTAGLRTFPLVAVAACGYMLVGMDVLGSTNDESRVMQGIIAGGAILKNEVKGGGSVSGTATAASLWLTGAIGISVATGRLEIALVLSALTFFTLRLLTPAKVLIRTSENGATQPQSSQQKTPLQNTTQDTQEQQR
jgi:putative Mg2+ transporter-C (MgtC) family protein